MIIQDQTFLSGWATYNGKELPIHGNCLMATYACYLDLDINDVPQFQFLFESKQPEHFWDKCIELWLMQYGLKEVNWLPEYEPTTKGWTDYYFAWGMTARGLNHQVIYKDGELFHDPHPSKAGLTEIKGFITLEKIQS